MTLIFLNGCTSAGKSSIAESLQELLTEPHLVTGIDRVFEMLPKHLHNHPEGFFFDRNGENIRLNFGSFGLAALKAHHRAAAAMAKSGVDLILDEVILTPDLRNDWLSVLEGLDVLFVGVHCELLELERREIERGDRLQGQARGQFNLVHKDMIYDVEVDTTKISSSTAAKLIIETMDKKGLGGAMSRMIKETG